MLESLVGDLELAIRVAVQHNPSCPPELVRLVQGQHEIASNWDTDAQQLATLAQSRWDWIRLAVAQNPSTSEETLLRLAEDKIFKVQLAVAKNPVTPASVLSVLAEQEGIQATVAVHLNATEEILHSLFPTQQHLIKSRENLPTSILERLVQERSPKTPLWQNQDLRYLLLKQVNTPGAILAELANTNQEDIGAKALSKIAFDPSSELAQNVAKDASNYLVDVAKHPQVSEKILEKLAQFPNPKVQLAVVQNQKTPEELRLQLLEELAVHPDYEIRTRVAEDLNTPESILERMVENESYQHKLLREIRRVLASEYPENSRSYEGTTDKLMSDLKHKVLYPANITIDVDRWMEIIKHPITWGLMTDNTTPTSTLWSLMPSVRRLINQVIPQWAELLPELSEDSFKRVVMTVHDILGIIKGFVQSHQFMRSVAVALVGNPNLPVTLREQLQNQLTYPIENLGSRTNDIDMRMALAYNPSIPEAERIEYFQQLISTSWNDVNEKIAQNPNTPVEILTQLMAKSGVGRQAIARNPHAPANALAELIQDTNQTTRNWVAENPGTPVDILKQLARQPVEKTINNVSTVRETVLKNPNFPLLERYCLLLEKEQEQENEKANQILAKQKDSFYALAQVVEKREQKAKLTAARNHKTSIAILEQLAKDSDVIIRQVVAQNRNLPLNSLLELAQDSSVQVRLSLLNKSSHSRIKTPVQLLEQLAQDESEQVRTRVAEHPDAPGEILVRLANDSSLEVKKKLTGNLNTPVTVLKRLGLEENIVNQRNPNTPPEVLAQAVNHFNNEQLADFIKYPVEGSQMPPEMLAKLANHSYYLVRDRVAAHPNTPTYVLEQLALDERLEVRLAVAQNSNTPAVARALLQDLIFQPTEHQISPTLCSLSRIYNPNIDDLATFLREYAQSDNEFVRFVTLLHPVTPVEVLQQAAQSASWLERYAVADNPATPTEIKQQLTQDSNQIIRVVAMTNLAV